MKLQAIVSSLAIAAALTFSGAAVAQNMIGDVQVPADQVQKFKDACAALEAKSTASLTTDDSAGQQNGIDPTTTASTTPSQAGPSDSSDPAAQDNWDELIAGLTLEQCASGGFMAQ